MVSACPLKAVGMAPCNSAGELWLAPLTQPSENTRVAGCHAHCFEWVCWQLPFAQCQTGEGVAPGIFSA
jgi:hypothetical protein